MSFSAYTVTQLAATLSSVESTVITSTVVNGHSKRVCAVAISRPLSAVDRIKTRALKKIRARALTLGTWNQALSSTWVAEYARASTHGACTLLVQLRDAGFWPVFTFDSASAVNLRKICASP